MENIFSLAKEVNAILSCVAIANISLSQIFIRHGLTQENIFSLAKEVYAILSCPAMVNISLF